MRHSTLLSPFTFLLASLIAFLPSSSATRLIESSSLNPCQANSSFSASLFNVVFTPDNNTLSFNIVGVSSISGNVTAELLVIAYGYTALRETLDPCSASLNLGGLCPMNTGQINIQSNINIPSSVINQVPGIAYSVPDLDGKVQIYINDTDTGKAVACVEAELSNGKTVDQKGVGWATAVIAGLALLASAITSGLGHSNTAAHVAANALSLFGYFQSQAIIGMAAVPVPPIVASWTQNFQWSMGIIRIGFLQDICTWYQRATGGTPSSVLSNLRTTSVQVQKRSVEVVWQLFKRAYHDLMTRSNSATNTAGDATTAIVVRGIERVGFRARIEITNIFLTGYAFFVIFVMFIVIGVIVFKLVCEALVKGGRLKGDKFQEFRNGWTTVLKGILFRIVLIGFPQMVVLCFWELTVRDSAAEVVLAIFTVITMICMLAWASTKVIRLARRSIAMHKNPAYILYSDPVSLNKWGFLYVQFKATAYYFIVPILGFVLIKGMFIALSQSSGTVQAIALVVLEACLLITVSILRPYMDKKTNGFNIAISASNFLSAIFLLVFTGIFNQPGIVTGVMGVIFFIYNAVFALILLLMVLISTIYALASKNPDTRYQPMRDDRGSFIKSQTMLTTELDALGATARGDSKLDYRNGSANNINHKTARIEDDDESWSNSSTGLEAQKAAANANFTTAPSMTSYPSDVTQRHAPPSFRSNAASPAPSTRGVQAPVRGNANANANAGGGMWQRGAGYEH